MGSIFSYKAEDRTPIYQNPSFKYDAITNSDPIFPKEEANDKTKEDEVHIPVEEQQEKDQVKKQEEENDEDMADEVKLEVEKKEEEGNQEGSSKETEASRDSHLARLLSNATKCRLRLRSDVLGDGNCYFRALADQLKRVGLLESVNTTSHEKLREGICDYMQYYPTLKIASLRVEKDDALYVKKGVEMKERFFVEVYPIRSKMLVVVNGEDIFVDASDVKDPQQCEPPLEKTKVSKVTMRKKPSGPKSSAISTASGPSTSA